MKSLKNKKAWVIGLGTSGRSACRLLARLGAAVRGIDEAGTEALRDETAALRDLGVEIVLGGFPSDGGDPDLVVLSPGVPRALPFVRDLIARNIPVIGELELAFQHASCLNIAITGTNGKTTTTELVERVLLQCGRHTIAAGNIGLPACDVVERSSAMDYLTLEVSSFQLESTEFFRPSIAVVTNLTPDHLDRYRDMEEYLRAKARIFANQQIYDWAVVQLEALRRLESIGVKIPSKVITYSATDDSADLYFDRDLLISRLPDWSGPLLDIEKCRLRGPHNAENLMAALAVSRILRLTLGTVVEALTTYEPAPHRCELVAEIAEVRFVNDSKATNLDATAQALRSLPGRTRADANVWLIAGGKDKGFEYHDIGPLLSQRVKGAFLLGETREKLRAAWSLFVRCELVDDLPEAVIAAARAASPGDVVLLSPACSSFDQFRGYQHRGEVFRETVDQLRMTGLDSRPVKSESLRG